MGGGDCKDVAVGHCVAICDYYTYAIERSIAVLLLIAELVRCLHRASAT